LSLVEKALVTFEFGPTLFLPPFFTLKHRDISGSCYFGYDRDLNKKVGFGGFLGICSGPPKKALLSFKNWLLDAVFT